MDRAGATRSPAPWLAVTGTNGKTTTVGHAGVDPARRRAPTRWPAATSATPWSRPSARAATCSPSSCRASSCTGRPRCVPAAGCVLNVAEDHLDWHGSMAAYAAAKARALRGPVAVVRGRRPGRGGAAGRGARREAGGRHARRARPRPARRRRRRARRPGVRRRCAGRRRGRHARRPVRAHRRAGRRGAGPRARRAARRRRGRARGVPAGRAPRRRRRHGWTASPTSTTPRRPTRTRPTPRCAAAAHGGHSGAAAGAEPSAAVVWIVGGLLKGASVDALVAAHGPGLRAVVVIGTDRAEIVAAMRRHAPDVPVVEVTPGDDDAMAGIMTAAVRRAAALARPGDTVLLAPAAASMDQFTDYAARGDAFAAAVGRVAGEPVVTRAVARTSARSARPRRAPPERSTRAGRQARRPAAPRPGWPSGGPRRRWASGCAGRSPRCTSCSACSGCSRCSGW